MRTKNLFAKTRQPENAYATYYVENDLGDMWFLWKVLKTYQTPKNEKENPYARWMCAVKSPFTYDSWEYGDTYIHEIMQMGAKLLEATPEWRKSYGEEEKQKV